jgi:hypothetical protein
MSIVRRIMGWITLGHWQKPALETRLDAALAGSNHARDVVRGIVETSEAQVADAEELSGKTRERLVLLEARRARRRKDPHLSVIVEAMRIMEGHQ